MKNLFDNLPTKPPQELSEILAEGQDVRIARIVSTGQASPPGFWYDQELAEWLVVLKGTAGLLFEGESQPFLLQAGDSINILPHCKHRVEWTSREETTIWLTVFYRT